MLVELLVVDFSPGLRGCGGDLQDDKTSGQSDGEDNQPMVSTFGRLFGADIRNN